MHVICAAQFDESTAWETACEDWASDAAGLPTLHFDGFLDSVFELADRLNLGLKGGKLGYKSGQGD